MTFSGGECLAQMKQLVPACRALHKEGVHIAVETSLFTNPENVSIAIDNIDFFYVDLKIPDVARCAETLHGDMDRYTENLIMLIKNESPVVIRIPVIGGMTDDEDNRNDIRSFLYQFMDSILKIELIKGHRLGESKYRSLGIDIPNYMEVSDDLLSLYREELQTIGLEVDICRM